MEWLVGKDDEDEDEVRKVVAAAEHEPPESHKSMLRYLPGGSRQSSDRSSTSEWLGMEWLVGKDDEDEDKVDLSIHKDGDMKRVHGSTRSCEEQQGIGCRDVLGLRWQRTKQHAGSAGSRWSQQVKLGRGAELEQ